MAGRLLDWRPPAPQEPRPLLRRPVSPRDLLALVARARRISDVRPAAVDAARSALRTGEIDSHVAIAAAIRAIRLGR